jgi:hypothetical protein
VRSPAIGFSWWWAIWIVWILARFCALSEPTPVPPANPGQSKAVQDLFKK